MIQFTDGQLQSKINYVKSYLNKDLNAATASILDANANVEKKNVVTLSQEIHKDLNIQLNRKIIFGYIKKLFGEELAEEYLRQIHDHEIYIHDESYPFLPYCVAISMFPFLLHGMVTLGGESKAPKHLESFCGSFVNLVFAVSSQFAGAVATVEFLMFFDYFARREYGDNYLETNQKQIENSFQHVVYALNQPAASRGYQSVFWNISVFDKYYFDALFKTFIFPDGSKPVWESVNRLQKFFLSWFNKEREKALLTFPVITAALKTEEGAVCDTEYLDVISEEFGNGNSFFVYMSDSVDSLASCCRLRNAIDTPTFTYTLGGTGVSTGSLNVITLNINRMIQDGRDLLTEVKKIHKYQVAFRAWFKDLLDAGLLPVYDAGYIQMEKQYLTVGINGLVEAAEFLGFKISYNSEYVEFIKHLLRVIYDENRRASQEYKCMFNTEFVPAENLGVKNAKWDRADGYKVPRDCYNSYFYVVEDDKINPLDKFLLHGKEVIQYLDGGSALHLNLGEHLTKEGFRKLLGVMAKTGCNYFTYNVRNTICNDCGFIDKRDIPTCSKCGSKNIDHATRVIGYLKRESSFSEERQREASKRAYHIVKGGSL